MQLERLAQFQLAVFDDNVLVLFVDYGLTLAEHDDIQPCHGADAAQT